jgi:hypothetical protein
MIRLTHCELVPQGAWLPSAVGGDCGRERDPAERGHAAGSAVVDCADPGLADGRWAVRDVQLCADAQSAGVRSAGRELGSAQDQGRERDAGDAG